MNAGRLRGGDFAGRRASRGFTLIELIVTIAVVIVLGSLATVAYRRVQEASKATGCVSNLRQLGIALNNYLGEHNMELPALRVARETKADDVPVIDNTLDRYVSDKRVFACPADEKFAEATGTSYLWNHLLNGQTIGALNFMLVEDPSRIPFFGDKEGFHPYLENKINILYADGHATKEVKFFTDSDEPAR